MTDSDDSRRLGAQYGLGLGEGARLAGRNGDIWQKFVRGRTQESLADEYGLSQPTIAGIIKQVRDSIPEDVRRDIVQREAEFLDALRVDVAELFYAPLPPAFDRDGNPLVDPENGAVIRDATGRLNALGGLLKVMERHAKLLGTDAATKLDATVNVDEDQAATILAQEAARRLAEGNQG